MKYILASLLLFIISFNVISQEKYSRVRIDIQGNELHHIAALGIDITEGEYRKSRYLETDLNSSEILKLDNANISYSIIYDDVSAFYAERSANDKPGSILRNTDDEWTVPQNWEYGSMGSYYTLDEVMNELDDMFAMYPNLISEREPISSTNLTHDGRMQYWVRISDNASVNEEEPEVLYTGLHHAREAISQQQLIYYMWYLLENYDSDEEIKLLVDNTEMYFVPVINVDGYEYNHITDPDGGGMWRKNRRDNGGGVFGVDPNRNYGYMWGLDNQGSSPNPVDETYRGPSAFSEPEIQNLRDFCEANEFKISLNYHSYSNLLLYPWGWTEDPSADDGILHDFSVIMTKENNYIYGPGSTTIYPTNGGSDDWMYGEQTTKEKIYSYTPEVGNQGDGFWPTPSRIIPLCKEQMWQNMSAARLVGKYAMLTDQSPLVVGEIDGYLHFEIKRLGLTDTDLFTVSIEPLDDNLTIVGDPVFFENLELMQPSIDSIEYSLSGDIEVGSIFQYLLSVDNGDYITSDTIEKIYGTLVTFFDDDGDDMENWTSSKWNNTTADYHSSPASITDSPVGKYQNYENNIIFLDSTIDLTDMNIAFANFWTKWDIESGYDYVQFMVKDMSSGSWKALEGQLTKPGTQYQQEGEPVYDGQTNNWSLEEVNLADYIGKQVQFRFVLVSDSYVTEDGFYFDDFTISVASNTTDIPSDKKENVGLNLNDAFPNPSRDIINIHYYLNQSQPRAMIEIFDILGNIVFSETIVNSNRSASINIAGLTSGVYFYRLSSNYGNSNVKRFIKQ
ncbi:MAG: immune inhibitor A [Bacteroidetes bacterium]|nr:immune inhibitor A [Bacteroidota bacterium]